MRISAPLLVMIAVPWLGALSSAWGGEPGRLPAFARLGPLGSISTTAVSVALPSLPDVAPILPEQSARPRSAPDPSDLRVIPAAPKVPSLSALELSKEDDDEALLPRPGTLSTRFVTMPNPMPYLKNHSLGPHLKPDAEFDLSDRASFGVMGKLDGFGASDLTSFLGRTQPVASGAKASSAVPAMRSRDIGFGATLEIKLGE